MKHKPLGNLIPIFFFILLGCNRQTEESKKLAAQAESEAKLVAFAAQQHAIKGWEAALPNRDSAARLSVDLSRALTKSNQTFLFEAELNDLTEKDGAFLASFGHEYLTNAAPFELHLILTCNAELAAELAKPRSGTETRFAVAGMIS